MVNMQNLFFAWLYIIKITLCNFVQYIFFWLLSINNVTDIGDNTTKLKDSLAFNKIAKDCIE